MRLQARMNEWMNGKSIEQKGWNETSSKNEWMNMVKVLNIMDETRFRARMSEWMKIFK